MPQCRPWFARAREPIHLNGLLLPRDMQVRCSCTIFEIAPRTGTEVPSVGGAPLGLIAPTLLCGWLGLSLFVRVPQQHHLYRCESSFSHVVQCCRSISMNNAYRDKKKYIFRNCSLQMTVPSQAAQCKQKSPGYIFDQTLTCSYLVIDVTQETPPI